MHIYKNSIRVKGFFNKIFSYFIITIIVVFISSFCINLYYIKLLQKNIENNYTNDLSLLSKAVDTSIYELLQNTMLLTTSENLYNMLYFKKTLNLEDYYKLSEIFKVLIRFRAAKSFINNVYIIDKENNLVISSQGTASINEFFDRVYNNKKYDKDFWLNLNSYKTEYMILESSKIENKNNKMVTEVIPIAQFGINDQRFKNIFIVDMKKEYIYDLLNQSKLTKNSHLFIYDKMNDAFYGADKVSETIFGDKTLLSIIDNAKTSFTFKYENNKYLAIKYTEPQLSFTGFTYIAIVPYIDFIVSSLNSIFIPSLIILMSAALSVFIAYYLSKKIYDPIKKTANALKESINNTNNNVRQSGNELEFLNTQVSNIIRYNKKLTMELTAAVPYVCERYLLSILNNDEFFPEDEVEEFLSNYDLEFKHEYFCVIITNIDFSMSFYQNYNRQDCIEICNNILYTLRNLFEYKNYILSIKNNKICIILNIDNGNYHDSIIDIMKTFHHNLNLDKDFINVYSGIGKIYKGIEGLRQSYKEAAKAATLFSEDSNDSVKVYEVGDCVDSYYYTIEEENKLFNYILNGDIEKIDRLIRTIVENNISKSVSEYSFRQLYLQLYNTGLRVLNMMGLSLQNLFQERYIDYIMNPEELSLRDMSSYVQSFIKKLAESNMQSKDNFDAEKLIEYIDKNYNKDLYLDKIAEEFKFSSKYMSKLIKKSIGMPFQKYLALLRISKAKELLISTNKNIEEIASEVGYNSRHTFIRMFKLLEGITPSAYREVSQTIDKSDSSSK